MAALITALDNYTPKQIGENGHVEYGWSNNIRERILQLSFQVTRTDENGVSNLKKVLDSILSQLSTIQKSDSLTQYVKQEECRGYLSVLYRMIGHTRDIVDGKGEYTLTYMMIHTWYTYYPELALFALKCLVDLGDKKVHQYGSWKDLKYFCDYCLKNGFQKEHPLIQSAIQLTNEQLKTDYETHVSNPESTDISLVAKWVPREKSQFGWLYEHLATNYFSGIMSTAPKNTPSHFKAVLKCKTEYRKMVSLLNKKIDTLQIKQCLNTWSAIDPDHVTSISLAKQKKALLNKKKDGNVRYPDREDRVACAEKFIARIKQAVSGEKEMKGQRVGMADFTKQAIHLIQGRGSQDEIDLLNSQWRDNSKQNNALGKMIAMLDVSGSMEGDPMHVAIALGIRIAEKSVLGKRVMTFSAAPTWVNLEGHTDFVPQVEVIHGAQWGMNTNFHAALDMILDSIIQNKMEPEDVQDMVLVILSDMQMDSGDTCDKAVLYDSMKAKYEAAGIRVHGKAYKPPHILFWNLRSISGFPTLSNQANTSMMSGFSPTLLNLFCEQGMGALESCSPWSMLELSLENERYTILANKLAEILT